MSGVSTIIDGETQQAAKVNKKGRLVTESVTFTSSLEASIEGDHYAVSPASFPVFNDAAETALFYIKNDEKEQVSWALTLLTLITGASIGGADADWMLEFVINPTSGTIITAGTDAIVTQMNAGIKVPLTAIVKTGATGDTLIGGDRVKRLVPTTPIGLVIPLDAVIIPSGSSIGVLATPPTGNTSLTLDISASVLRLSKG